MATQHVRYIKAVFEVYVWVYNWLVGTQGMAPGGSLVVSESFVSHHTGLPIHSRTNKHFALLRMVFQQLHERQIQCFGNGFGSSMQEGVDVITAKCEQPEFS